MNNRYNASFKEQSVQKVLATSRSISVKQLASNLGVGYSTLQKWVAQSRTQQINKHSSQDMNKEKRPQDWTMNEKLSLIIKCGSLDDEAINQLCREAGVFAHHIKQWKQEIIDVAKPVNPTDIKSLKKENKALKKELNRKDKALAETAALLVLQKKVNQMWSEDE